MIRRLARCRSLCTPMERLILLLLLILISCGSINAQVVLSANATVVWNGRCISDCDSESCTQDRPCSLPVNSSREIKSNSGPCVLFFQPGDYSGAHYTIRGDDDFDGTLFITSNSRAVLGLNLSIVATEISPDVTLQSLVLSQGSSILFNTRGSVFINGSTFLDGSLPIIKNVTTLKITNSLLRPDSTPSLLISGHLSTLLFRETVASSDVSMILARGNSSFSLTLLETNFVGPTLLSGFQPLTSVNITASLLVGIYPYLFSRSMDATSLYMSGADIQGGLSNSTFFPSQRTAFTSCTFDDLSLTNFAIGNIHAQNLVLSNSLLWGPQGTFIISGSSPSNTSNPALTLHHPPTSPPTVNITPQSAEIKSSIIIKNNQFLRDHCSAPSLIIVGDNSELQTIQFLRNNWNLSGLEAMDMGEIEFKNVSSLVEFGTVSQYIPSLIFDHIRFNGTLSITSSLVGRNRSNGSMILAGDEFSTLELYSICLYHVNLTQFDGTLRYVASNPSLGLRGAESHLNVSDTIQLALNPSTLPTLLIDYPISYNTTCNFDSLLLSVASWRVELNCSTSNKTLTFRALSSGIKPEIAPYSQSPPYNTASTIFLIRTFYVVLATFWMSLN